MENKTEPTDAERLAILGQYLGRPVFVKNAIHTPDKQIFVTGVGLYVFPGVKDQGGAYLHDGDGRASGDAFAGSLSIAHVGVEVKPLWGISEEDMEQLSVILNLSRSTTWQAVDRIRRNGTERDTMWIDISITLIDELRSRGYAVGYKKWSVEQLVEFGIYRLTE